MATHIGISPKASITRMLNKLGIMHAHVETKFPGQEDNMFLLLGDKDSVHITYSHGNELAAMAGCEMPDGKILFSELVTDITKLEAAIKAVME